MNKFLLFACALMIGAFTSCKKINGPAPVTTIDSLRIGLLGYYQFNNGGADSSGKSNHVSYYVNMSPLANRFGIQNTAFYFNGVNSSVSVNDNVDLRLNNTDFTLNAWVKLDAYGDSFGYNVMCKHITGNDNGWAWGITGNAVANKGVVTFGPGSTSAFARGTKVIPLNEWHMMTSTYKTSTKKLSIYIDGVLDNVTDNIPTPNGSITSKLYIGRDEPTASFDGYVVKGGLDDLRIYNRLLTAAEIKKLYMHKN